jgi:MFS family permease
MDYVQDRNFRLYLTGVGTWFVGLAIQFILFPALVALALRAPAAQVGTAQMSLLLPMLLLLLPAGAFADRRDPRRIILVVQIAGAVPPLALAAAIHFGALNFPVLLAYGLTMGALSAIISPAREGLVPRIAGGALQQAVTATTGVQFGVQVFGSLLVFLVPPRFGVVPILLAQSFIYLGGAWAFSRIVLPVEDRSAIRRRPTWEMITDGLRVSLAAPRLRAVMGLNLAIGVLYMGVFLVAIPLLVRDLFAGTVREIALTSVFNQLGTILATVLLLRFGGVRRRGRWLVGSLLASALAIGALGLVESFAWMLFAIFVAGALGGTGLIMSRTVVQESAPDSHRNRVIALYTLSAMGGAPLGAQLMGIASGQFGVQGALLGAAALMLVTVTAVAAITGLARS